MQRYNIGPLLGSGEFGDVFLGTRKQQQQQQQQQKGGKNQHHQNPADHHHGVVAIKRMKERFHSWEEVKHLRDLVAARTIPPHPNVVNCLEVHWDEGSGSLNLIMEYLKGGSLLDLMNEQQQQPIQEGIIRSLMRQILQGIAHCHRYKIYHRDVKPENLLIHRNHNYNNNNANNDDDGGHGRHPPYLVCKLADFSLARKVPTGAIDQRTGLVRSPASSYIATRWYRAPEIWLGDQLYSYAVDVFACGAIMAELYELTPLFPGVSECDQLYRLFTFLGAPHPTTWLDGFQLAQLRGLDLSHMSNKGLIDELELRLPVDDDPETPPAIGGSTSRSSAQMPSPPPPGFGVSTLLPTTTTTTTTLHPSPSPRLIPPSRGSCNDTNHDGSCRRRRRAGNNHVDSLIPRLWGTTAMSAANTAGGDSSSIRPGVAFDLFRGLIALNPSKRLRAQQALDHEYFSPPSPPPPPTTTTTTTTTAAAATHRMMKDVVAGGGSVARAATGTSGMISNLLPHHQRHSGCKNAQLEEHPMTTSSSSLHSKNVMMMYDEYHHNLDSLQQQQRPQTLPLPSLSSANVVQPTPPNYRRSSLIPTMMSCCGAHEEGDDDMIEVFFS